MASNREGSLIRALLSESGQSSFCTLVADELESHNRVVPRSFARSVRYRAESEPVRIHVDPPGALPYRVGMAEELSKRIDDLHKRFDDLRTDIGQRFAGTDTRIDDLRTDMNQRFAGTDRRIDELRTDMNQRFQDLNHRLTDMHGTLRSFMWVVSGWFTFLTAVLAVFGFLRR